MSVPAPSGDRGKTRGRAERMMDRRAPRPGLRDGARRLTGGQRTVVLWDMDGTLVDTEEHWILAATDVLAGRGAELDEADRRRLVGAAVPDGAGILIAAGAPGTPGEVATAWTDAATRRTAAHGVRWRPGAVELLSALRRHGVPQALVTASPRAYASHVLAGLSNDPFRAVVAGDDVTRGKPFPDPYLRALELLGATGAAGVAVEDSITGLRAARSAGLATIGVPHHVAIPAAEADVVWPTLAGRGADDVLALAR